MPGADDSLSVAEVASILKPKQRTVRNWIDQGKLPAMHIGRRARIRRADFDAVIEASMIGDRQPEPVNISDGEISLPQAPGT